MEPGAVFLIHLLDMLEEAVVELRQQRAQMEGFTVLEPMRGLENLRKHLMMNRAMLGKTREPGLLHQLLLAPEMHAREFDELVQQLAGFFVAATAQQRQAQVVNGVHKNAVLVIHGANTNRAGAVPREKSQISLRE